MNEHDYIEKMETGRKAIISELAENPLDGIEHFLHFVDQPVPDVDSLDRTDVLIKIESSAINWVDLLMTSGQYQHQPPLPYTPGLEYGGQVLWMGSDANTSNIQLGDKVMVQGFLSGPRSPGKHQQYGGFATYAVAPIEALIPKPENLTFDQSCNLLSNYETAYHCLITRGKLQAGETVLIHGASGATGMAAVHIAKLLGARVIATGRSDKKLEIVKEQGADHTVNCKATNPDEKVRRFRDDVKDLTDGLGVDVVYDGVGGAVSEESLRCVKFNARFLIVGWASTPFVARGKGKRGAPNANRLPTNLIMMKSLQVLGCPSVIAAQKDPSIRKTRVDDIFKWVGEGKIAPYVSQTFPLSELKTALRAKWNGEIIGSGAVYPD